MKTLSQNLGYSYIHYWLSQGNYNSVQIWESLDSGGSEEMANNSDDESHYMESSVTGKLREGSYCYASYLSKSAAGFSALIDVNCGYGDYFPFPDKVSALLFLLKHSPRPMVSE